VEIRKKFPSKGNLADLAFFEENTEKIITALRLFSRGAVRYSTILTYPKVWRTYFSSLHYKRGISGLSYILTNDEAENFKAFWKKIESLNIQEYPFMDVAVRRFISSYERRLPEDKLIDFITAFEALFLKKEEGELSYRLALRCAYFLGQNKEERKKTYEIIRDAYKVRNKIVHGKAAELPYLTELSTEVEEYLRQSIKKFLDYLQAEPCDEKIHDKIIDKIDEAIIAGGCLENF